MILEQLFDKESSTMTYLLGDASSGRALLLDAVMTNVDRYLARLRDLDLRLDLAIDTHTHADHITAQSVLRDITGCRILVSRQSRVSCGCATFDGDRMLRVGELGVVPLYTPGHTVDSYSFFVQDRGRPILFTGDTLLIRGTGRTDFQGGSAARQYDSIFGTLLQFPDETLIYPGHDYHGRRVSTIGEERSLNPRLNVSGKAEYVDLMSKLDLPPPKLMKLALAANKTCGQTN
jgi:sulfur dioxygenase